MYQQFSFQYDGHVPQELSGGTVGGSEFELMGGIVLSSILFTEAIAAMKVQITTKR